MQDPNRPPLSFGLLITADFAGDIDVDTEQGVGCLCITHLAS